MINVLAIAVALLLGFGIYLLLQRSYLRIALGLGLISHGVHLILLVAGGEARQAPVLLPEQQGTILAHLADPLPQALVLTAIVISMAMTLYLLAGLAALALLGQGADARPEDNVDDEGADEPPAQFNEHGGDS